MATNKNFIVKNGLEVGGNVIVTGQLTTSGMSLPASDGSNGQFLQTDGAGNLSFATVVSDFTISDGTTTDTVNTGETLTFTGGTGITTAVTGNTVTISSHASYTDAEAIAAVEGASNLTIDGGTLYVDTSNNYIGINDTSPQQALDVTGAIAIAGTTVIDSGGEIVTAQLKDSGVTAASYGSASLVPVITVDAKGRITSASTTSVAGVSSFSFNTTSEILTINTADGGSFTADISGLASENYVDTAVSNLVDSAPGTLDTLNELAAALGDDANFASTITSAVNGKVSKLGDSITGALSISSNLTVDTNTLFVDATNNRVGIGTTSPSELLHVSGGTTKLQSGSNSVDALRIDGNGGNNFIHMVGNQGQTSFRMYENGTDDPAYFQMYNAGSIQHSFESLSGGSIVFNEQGLDIDFRVESNNNSNMLFVNGGSDTVSVGGTNNLYGTFQVNQSNDNDESGLGILNSTSGRSLRLWCDSTTSYINSGDGGAGNLILNQGAGKVGIGTSSPSHTLQVQGVISSRASNNVSNIILSDDSGGTTAGARDSMIVGVPNTPSQMFVAMMHGRFENGANKVNIGGMSTHSSGNWDGTGVQGATELNFYTVSSVNTETFSSTSPSMHINSSGNVGIGTTSPDSKLEVSGSGNQQLKVTRTNEGVETVILSQSGEGWIGTQSNHNLKIGTAYAAKMLLNTSGNLAIGGALSPARRLDVRGGSDYQQMRLASVNQGNSAGIEFSDELSSFSQIGYLRWTHSDGNTATNTGQSGNASFVIGSSEADNVIGFNSGMTNTGFGSNRGSIKYTSSGTTYNTTSDRRLKENIELITDGKEKLLAMKPSTFNFIEDENKTKLHGFIAQEMQEVVPEAVSDGPTMSMDYGRITPVIVAALQEALKEIDMLKEKVKELEAK